MKAWNPMIAKSFENNNTTVTLGFQRFSKKRSQAIIDLSSQGRIMDAYEFD